MELTPEKFEKAEFTERRRGYDIDQVESFLEETGTEFAQMLAKFRHTEQRAAAAEERAAAAESRLSQTDSIVAEATDRVQRAERAARAAQQQAAEAQQAAAQGAAAQGAANEHAARANEAAEIEQAAKTLLMAQRTADATVNEARVQAQTLLEDARSRADRQQAESTAEAEELVRLARLQAEEEYAERRAAVLDEVRSLEARRAQLADVITQLEARLAGYRSELNRTAEELSALVEDPSRLGARPNMSIPPDEVLPSSGPATGESLGDADSTEVDDAVEDYLGALGDTDPAADATPAGTSTTTSGTSADDAGSSSTTSPAGETEHGPGGGSASTTEPTAAADRGADAHYVDLTAPNSSLDTSGQADATWGPGSWSQLEADIDPDAEEARRPEVISATAATSSVRAATGSSSGSVAVADSGARPAEASPAPRAAAAPEVVADDDYVDDRPTQAVDRADAPRDRYMQELDDAVNDTGTVSTTDDAMTAFFEGTSESKTRRFGWRR